jgi:methylated-DNA-[protein]-cysteine S-methyltransferase
LNAFAIIIKGRVEILQMPFDIFKYDSPVGAIYCVFEGPVLVELSIKDRPAHAAGFSGKASALSNRFKAELDDYFAGTLKKFVQRVKFIEGTAFQQKIWKALMEVPFGQTRSYRWIAGKAGSPAAARAAGQALSRNPLPIIVPCHRIISSNGSPGGYSSGVEIKQWLLRHEKGHKM